jgi:hypothetical protein
VMDAFDRPVPAGARPHPLRRGLVRGATRDPQRDLTRARVPVFFLRDSRAIRKTCPTWGTSRSALSAGLHQIRRVSMRP